MGKPAVVADELRCEAMYLGRIFSFPHEASLKLAPPHALIRRYFVGELGSEITTVDVLIFYSRELSVFPCSPSSAADSRLSLPGHGHSDQV